MVDSVVDFAASNQLLATADDYFDWQEFDELVEDVKGREEDQVPSRCHGNTGQTSLHESKWNKLTKLTSWRLPRPEPDES